METFNLFGEYIGITELKERAVGTIQLPDSRATDFRIGRICALGDGVIRENGKKLSKEILYTIGQIVVYKIPKIVTSSSTYAMTDNNVIVIHQRDVLFSMSKPIFTFENYEPAGEWILVEAFKREGERIILVDGTDAIEKFRFRVKRISDYAQKILHNLHDLIVVEGDELAVNRIRLEPLRLVHSITADLETKEYMLAGIDHVFGKVEREG